MQDDGTAKQIARWVALIALFLIPITPLLVADSFFFPFISGKAFYFRVLVEIAVVAWGILAFLDRNYRPRFSWIGVAAVAFVVWMGIADLFAINVAKAFWSNFERMEGWVFLVHLLGFFGAASAVLRAEKKWRAWFLTSLGVSVVIVGYALMQLGGSIPIHQGSVRIDATLGNSAYLAIYLLFSVCVALWLALTEKQVWLKWSLIVLSIIEIVLIFYTETRGTIIALVLGAALAALLTLLTSGRRARQFAGAGLVALLLLVGGFYLARNSSFVQNNHVLQRVASISLADGGTRFKLWHMAWEGVQDRPIVGWGQEGFNYIFNAHYDPSLYLQEQWFDRAHNAFIDWLTAGGIPALLLYLSLFGTAFFMLWRSSELSRAERIALTAALVGYAVHNIFVFDNLSSYIYFFAILALIDSQVARPITPLEAAAELDGAGGVTYALPIGAATLIVLVWAVNVPGMQVASKLIDALSPSSAGIAGNLATFEELAAHPSFAAQEVREQIISFAGSVVQSSSATDAEKQRAATLAVTEMQKQIAAYPKDAREYLQLSYIYRAIGNSADAAKAVQAAILLSPRKEQMWVEAGAIAWDAGDSEGARDAFTMAYTLGPQFTDLAAYAAAGNIGVGDIKAADTILLEAFGTTTVDNDILNIAYYRTKNWPRLIDLWKLRVSRTDATAQTWFGLAAAYYAAGDTRGAIATLKAAATAFPDSADSVTAALKQIEGGTAGQ
jgi:O-antigen ligase/tetratricopeptide (TPR) repeat protein